MAAATTLRCTLLYIKNMQKWCRCSLMQGQILRQRMIKDTRLCMTSFLGALSTVKMLVEAGADVRATDAKRDTCLILAAYHGHTDTVRYLVGLPEVDLNHQGSDHRTALQVAVKRKHADVVQVLIDAGAIEG